MIPKSWNLVLGLGLIVCTTGHAAAEEVSQLQAQLQRSRGTVKVDLLVKLVKAHLYGKQTAKALKLGAQAVQAARAAGYSKGLAAAYSVKGVAHRRAGDYDQALECYFRAMKLKQALGDRMGVANLHNNIGLVHWNLEQYRQALAAYSRSLKLTRALDPQAKLDKLHNNIGLVHYDLGDYKRALSHHLKALAVRKHGKNKRHLASTLNNIAIVYTKLGRLDEAQRMLQRALRLNEALGYVWGVANVHQNLGDVYFKLGQTEKAKQALLKGLELAKQSEAKQLVSEGHQLLSAFYGGQGDYKQALNHFERHAAVKDAILNQKTSARMAEFATRLDLQRKEQQIALLTKNKQIRELQLRRQRVLRNSLLVGLALFVLVAFVIYNRYRLKARAHEKIVEALERINTLQGLLPICASCKKIRDDGGYWHQVEAYVEQHSEAEFSHGLCPECVESLYPGRPRRRRRKSSGELSPPSA
jgi:two-component system sensor histidine kinase/response regulator